MARPRRPVPGDRRSAARLCGPVAHLQQRRHPRPQGGRRRPGPVAHVDDLRRGVECRARRERDPAIGRPPRGDAGRPLRRRDRDGLPAARPRTGHGGGQAAADRHFLQQAVFHGRQHRVRRARRGGVGRHRRSAEGARRFGRLHAGTAGRGAVCADESGAELCAVPAAGDPADRAARRRRRRRGLRRRIGVRRAQHGRVAGGGRRRSA